MLVPITWERKQRGYRPKPFHHKRREWGGSADSPQSMNVKVYQMKDGEKYHGLRFRELPDDVNGLDLRDYDLVWDGLTAYPESNDIQILNNLFHKLNVGEKPISYHGHSLSVSDLVALEDRLYCCQSIGWKPVTVMVRRSVRPSGGDAVRLASPWRWGLLPAGSIGIIGGITDEECEESASITFNFSAFRGRDSKYSKGPEHCSCSGGPGTTATPVSELRPTGETHTYTAWRWREYPQADGGEAYQVTVTLYEWAPDY